MQTPLFYSDVIGLHLGCGKNPIFGWLNTDLRANPKNGIVALDATKPFPFDNESFDCVFTEHMLEHVPYPAGKRMIQECFRVLRPSGTLRISTPDFRFLLDIYTGPRKGIQERYVQWATEQFIPTADQLAPIFVVNNFVRAWGHQFIYDEELLCQVLESCGFVDVCRWKVGESENPVLRGIENNGRMPDGFLELESMVLEARKPTIPVTKKFLISSAG